jgi:predicted permease
VLSILTVTSPFFLLVLAGYVAIRTTLLPLSAINGLNTFVLYFALPCMLFRYGSNTPIEQLLNLPLAAVYLLCSLLLVAIAIVISRRQQLDWNNTALGALVATFPNTGYMGAPLLLTIIGASAAGPVIVTIFIDIVIISSLCVGLSRITPDNDQAFIASIQQSFKGMVSNPMPWAICLGVLASGFDAQLPAIFESTVGLLGNAASPTALFTIGAVLARSAMQSKIDGHAPPIETAIYAIVAIKLLAHPAIIALGFAIANELGAGIDPAAIAVVVLLGALPSASNVTLLAERFGADAGRIAKIVLITTTLAFFSFPAFVSVLHPS